MKGMKDEEYQACLSGLGLLEGEQIRLQYVCYSYLIGNPSPILVPGGGSPDPVPQFKKGLLVFTNDNMIFMSQERMWSKNYGQEFRISLEQIAGVIVGGTLTTEGFQNQYLLITVGTSGSTEQHEFIGLLDDSGKMDVRQARAEIEATLKEAREEKKRFAAGNNPRDGLP